MKVSFCPYPSLWVLLCEGPGAIYHELQEKMAPKTLAQSLPIPIGVTDQALHNRGFRGLKNTFLYSTSAPRGERKLPPSRLVCDYSPLALALRTMSDHTRWDSLGGRNGYGT